MTINSEPRTILPISVVIPAFNASKYLKDAITSVLSQTVGVQEIIVVNDGSTDDTEEIALQMGVRIINQENKGLSGARNTGILNAKNDWIALLDVDDVWLPSKLEEQWITINRFENTGIISCDHADIDDSGKIIRDSYLGSIETSYEKINKQHLDGKYSLINEFGDAFWSAGYFLSPSTMLFRKDLAIKVGLFNEKLAFVEDVDFFARLLNVSPLAVVELPLTNYRVHTSNWSKNEIGMVEGFLMVMDLMQIEPHKYPRNTYKFISKDLSEKLRFAGVLQLKENNFEKSRNYLLRSLKLKFSLYVVLLLLVTFLPSPVIKYLSSLRPN